jgi:ferredoxin/flavodoxin
MKALILYFSGTGNTKFMARQVEAALQEFACDTEIHSIDEDFTIVSDSYDLLVLGAPKYYEYPVYHFIQYIKNHLPNSTKPVPTMMFCTQAGPLPTDFCTIRRMLERKNHLLTVEKSIPIANNLTVFSSFKGTDEAIRRANLTAAQADSKLLVSDLVTGSPKEETIGKALAIADRAVAVLCTKWFPRFGMKFGPSDACTGCGLCARKCPKKNITMQNGKPAFGKNCIFCTRCMNICPSHAILYHNRKCPQYNIIEKI